MQKNICNLSLALLLSAGLFNDGKLLFTEAEDDESDTDTLQLSSSSYLPSTPYTELTLITSTHGDWNDTDYEVTTPEDSETDIITILLYASPAIILVIIILLIIFFVKRKRRKKDKKDVPASDDVKSPIFEEDTPSVMEIEMDDLDKWMNYMRKGSNRLSTLEEEKPFKQGEIHLYRMQKDFLAIPSAYPF